jgi:hypothetical protein
MKSHLAIASGVLLLAAATSHAAITYVDATSGIGGNTTLANGSVFTPPLNGTTGADNNWEQRTTFGSGGNIFEAGGETNENAPELMTTIVGLTPGHLYSIYVYFWDPTSTAEDWNIRAGATSNPSGNTLFSAADATAELSSTAAVLASTQAFDVAPTIFAEGNRALLAGSVGILAADSNGTISVFIDDLPTTNGVNFRTWYDGVGYEFSAIPEPGVSLLAAVGLLGVLRRRR